MNRQKHAGEKETAPGVMAWTCPMPSCKHVIRFRREDADTRGFLIIHHLVDRHGWTRGEVLNYDSHLSDAAEEYRGFPTDKRGRVM